MAVQLETVCRERTGTITLQIGKRYYYEFDLRVMADMKQRNLDTRKVRKITRTEWSFSGRTMYIRTKLVLVSIQKVVCLYV